MWCRHTYGDPDNVFVYSLFLLNACDIGLILNKQRLAVEKNLNFAPTVKFNL